MSIESELKKDGIEVVEKLDIYTINDIADKVSARLYQAFPNFGFDQNELYEKISNCI